MAKKYKRYNPYNPKIGLYEYRVNVKNKSRVIASGRSYGRSIAQMKASLSKLYHPNFYSLRIKKVAKTMLKSDRNYQKDKAKYGTTSLYY